MGTLCLLIWVKHHPHRQAAGILKGRPPQVSRHCCQWSKVQQRSALHTQLGEMCKISEAVRANPSHRLDYDADAIWQDLDQCDFNFDFTEILVSFSSYPPSLFLSLQAFGQAYTNQRKVAEDGETNEETLLQESASKEAYYMGRLLELQSEVTLSRSVASNAQSENERLNALVQELREVSLSTRGLIMQRIYYFLNKEKQEIESTVCVRKQHFTFLYIFMLMSAVFCYQHLKFSLWDVHISCFGLQLTLDWARYSKS